MLVWFKLEKRFYVWNAAHSSGTAMLMLGNVRW
jgi:hypothetical protein